MLGKIKKALGIEGVKVEIILDKEQNEGSVSGMLKFTTKSDSKVKSFKLSLSEIYSRGRGKNKRTNTYELGKDTNTDGFSISRDEIVEVPFLLPYSKLDSEMDRIADSNFISAGIVMLAKKLKRVSSEYKLRVEVDVQGTKLDPYAEVDLDL